MPNNKGFSLVELSVVLAVIGITLGGALTLATKKTEADKINQTQKNMDIIEAAFDRFLTQNQRLPCPASGSLAHGVANFGEEAQGASPPSNTTSCLNLGAGHGYDNTANIYAGVVPTKTLGLHDDLMLDGWGRRITYVVDFRFANNATTNVACDDDPGDICFKFIADGSITINDSTGAARTTTAVYTLISHGKNGKGAWKYIGDATRLPTSTDADEQSNAGDDLAATFDATFVQKDTIATFDDIVRYRPKWQIIDEAEAITDESLCTAVLAENDPTNNVCLGANNTTICGNMVTQVSNLCVDS